MNKMIIQKKAREMFKYCSKCCDAMRQVMSSIIIIRRPAERFRAETAERPAESRTQFDELLGRIGMDLEPITQRSQAMSDENKLLIALCFYATGSFCWEIGDVQ